MRTGGAPWTQLIPAFVSSAALGFASTTLGPGCQSTCRDQFDCGDQQFCDSSTGRCTTECFTDQDCRRPPECLGNPTACAPRGLRCSSVGRCLGKPMEPPAIERPDSPVDSGALVDIEGWDHPPGSGHAFIVDSLAVAEEGRGFDVDGSCRGPGDCMDNSLWRLGRLGNDQIRQGLLGGETLLLLEIAGLDEPFAGHDRSVTVKLYGAKDADDPFFPANNFQIPSGETECCEFELSTESLSPDRTQARARAPARIHRGKLESLAAVPIEFKLTVGVAPHPSVRIERARLEARLGASLSSLGEGMLGGAIPIGNLAQVENPYCKTLNALCTQIVPDSALIDLVATYMDPDVDLDVPRDGLEVLEQGQNGRISRCLDGDGLVVPPIPASAPPWMCALNPRMADGYSIGLRFSGVRATIVGVGQ